MPTYLEPEMLHVHRHVTGLAGWEPVVVTQKIKGEWTGPQPEIVPRSRWRELGRFASRIGFGPWQLTRAECRAFDRATAGCSILHLFFGNSALHELGLIGLRDRPSIVSFHGSDATGLIARPSSRRARMRMFRGAALVACRSKDLAMRVENLGCPPEKVRILRTVLADIPRAAFDWHPPGDGSWRLFHAGRLVPKKGGQTLLRAFRIFHDAFPLARLTMAGEGPLRQQLSLLAGELGIAGAVDFAGFLDQTALRSAFATSHIYVHPSETVDGDKEGIPNSLLEAMAGGLPCVATRHGGIPEAVTDGLEGLIVPEADHRLLAEALLGIARRPEIAAGLGARARERVIREFSPASWQSAVSAIYSEAAGRRP